MSLAEASDPLKACAAVENPADRLACYDTAAGRAPQALSPAPAAPAPVASPEQGFGAEHLKEIPADGQAGREIARIESRIRGSFQEWKRGTLVALENGQVWKCAEGEGYYPGAGENPAVTIEKSFFGSYWMVVQGIGRKIKVVRVR